MFHASHQLHTCRTEALDISLQRLCCLVTLFPQPLRLLVLRGELLHLLEALLQLLQPSPVLCFNLLAHVITLLGRGGECGEELIALSRELGLFRFERLQQPAVLFPELLHLLLLGAAWGGGTITASHRGSIDFILQLLCRGGHGAHASLLRLQGPLDSGELGVELVILEVFIDL